jgi:DNA adenine methylase
MHMPDASDILENALRRAKNNIKISIADDNEIRKRARYIVRCSTKAGIRAMLACCLAKILDPSIDIRKPYTEIKDSDSYSGRTIDETHIGPFITKHDLPANQTTAWLTPAFRTNSSVLKPGVKLGGTPAKLYETVIQLLNDVYQGRVSPEDTLILMLEEMLTLKYERENRLAEMIEEIGSAEEKIPLSSEEIVSLIQQHLESPRSSRLPVLVVTAAYQAAKDNLGETVKALYSHNAPDLQTGALGDVEITLQGSNGVITSYEMKGKEVKKGDIDVAISKINSYDGIIDNYIFITTEEADDDVEEYAQSMYRPLGGIEIAILDCLGFIKHFLHLFHRLRIDFVDSYQDLVLAEPESAVSQPLKEVFLSLRRAAESAETEEPFL